jgi:hypothetical protein
MSSDRPPTWAELFPVSGLELGGDCIKCGALDAAVSEDKNGLRRCLQCADEHVYLCGFGCE